MIRKISTYLDQEVSKNACQSLLELFRSLRSLPVLKVYSPYLLLCLAKIFAWYPLGDTEVTRSQNGNKRLK